MSTHRGARDEHQRFAISEGVGRRTRDPQAPLTLPAVSII